MLNVKATPCEKSKAIVLVSEECFGISEKFTHDLQAVKPYDFDLFFELVHGVLGLFLNVSVSFDVDNPKRWYRFLKFCKKDGRIKVYRKNNKMVYEVPTCFEE